MSECPVCPLWGTISFDFDLVAGTARRHAPGDLRSVSAEASGVIGCWRHCTEARLAEMTNTSLFHHLPKA